jgi:hypothetical protein
LAAFSLRLSSKPAAPKFLSGYERIAFFSAGFKGAMIVVAAIWAPDSYGGQDRCDAVAVINVESDSATGEFFVESRTNVTVLHAWPHPFQGAPQEALLKESLLRVLAIRMAATFRCAPRLPGQTPMRAARHH